MCSFPAGRSRVMARGLLFFEGAPQNEGRVGKDAEAPWPAYVSDFLANSDGLKLVRAFTQIGDAQLRRSLVRLVEEIVGEGDN
jgi:hypothetical protein